MRVLVCDFFGVVVSEMLPPFFKAHISDEEEAKRIKLSYSDKADVGLMTFDEEISNIASDMGLDKDLVLEECYEYSKPNKRLVDMLRRSEIPVILLSNAPEGLVESMFDRYSLDDLFKAKVISYIEKIAKPDRRIYEAVYRYFDPKSEFLFIDDNEKNLTTPKILGWRTLKFDQSEACYKAIFDFISGK